MAKTKEQIAAEKAAAEKAAAEKAAAEKAAAEKAAAEKAAAKAKTYPALKVTCRKDSFIRAGIKWTKEPKTVLVDRLPAEKIAAIKAEPMLIVEEVELASI